MTEALGAVYVIGEFNGEYKIGCCRRVNNVKQRLYCLRYLLQSDLQIIKVFETEDVFGKEGYLHMFFADKRTCGEWFALNDVDISIIKEASSLEEWDYQWTDEARQAHIAHRYYFGPGYENEVKDAMRNRS